jgi:probable HAF family extracellular repeat protein
MSRFTWAEIKLPAPFYVQGGSFAEAWGISPDGTKIVGTFGVRVPNTPVPLAGEYHGFLKAAALISDGTIPNYPALDVFGSYDMPNNVGGATSATGINDSGSVVGFYRDEARGREIHGFAWFNGDLMLPTPFDFDPQREKQDFPNAGDPDLHNAVLGTNNQGQLVGVYRQAATNKDLGFVAHDFQTFFPVDLGSASTQVTAINSNGDFVGFYQDYLTLNFTIHGFKWKVDNRLNPVGDPVLINIFLARGFSLPLRVTGINDNGWIVGYYDTLDSKNHGFVWKPNLEGIYAPGTHLTIDIVGATDTVVSDIANNGTFVGMYRDGQGRHAFVGSLFHFET